MSKNKSTLNISGDERLAANLKMYSKDMTEKVARAMFEFGGEIQRRSEQLVPRDTGELASRSFVEGPLISKDGSEYLVVVGYEKHGAPTGTQNKDTKGQFYAVPVHERMDVNHPNGQAKYLEQPYKESASEYLEYMAEAAEEARP